MAYKYDMLVFIGRFQPLHLGHQAVIDRALTLSKRVLVLVGSSNRSPDQRNPWSFEDRSAMIREEYPDPRVVIRPLLDMMYDDEGWVRQAQNSVKRAVVENLEGNSKTHFSSGLNDVCIGLIGCAKDETSYYLNLFPTWGSERVDDVVPLSSTNIRKFLFETNAYDQIREGVSESVYTSLMMYSQTDAFKWMQAEIAFNRKYKDTVQKYPRLEQTVDAVVVQSGHVLLVRRRSQPGMGKWALPGGFVNPNETFRHAVLRELREETKIRVPLPVLQGCMGQSERFDDPNRSMRGRIITEAFPIHLKPGPLPKVKGSDDAEKAGWIPLSELDPKEMFEDHYFIIQRMLGRLG